MPVSDPLVGRTVSHYRVLGMLGAGGMGVVYLAEDLNLGRRVALKFLPQAFARDAERMTRFEREAKVLASLNHPNIASIYGLEDAGGLEDSGGAEALAMELVEGPTLAERIRSGPLPIDEALGIARQIAEALEYAHERGIVHRDLKPANVKVTSDDTVKVLDFGLAKAVEGDAAADLSNSPTISRMSTQAGVLLGTAAYMSPEQAKGKPVDRRADIWAFGCVLYETLSGQMAFQGETVTETLAAVIRGEPAWFRLPAETPVRVRALLERCLQKDPKRRLRDIGDARISLDEVLSGAPEPVLAGAALPTPASWWRRALPWALFAAAAAVAAALAFVHLREKPIAAETTRFAIPAPEEASISPTGSFALSPDGRHLAFFAAGSDGVERLWIRSMDSVTARPLPGSESDQAASIIWSPDSRYIAYGADGKLKKIDLTGGPPETLCAVHGAVDGGSWNRDGIILFGSGNGIMRVPAAGGSASQVTVPDASSGEIAHVLPVFLPDGRHFLYQRLLTIGSGIYIGSLDAKPGRQDRKQLLASDYGVVYAPSSGSGMGRLLFLRDGVLMAQPFNTRRLALVGDPVAVASQVGNDGDFGFFSVSDNGALVSRAAANSGISQLTWFDGQGKILGTAGEPGLFARPSLSPDGAQAVVERIDPQTNKHSLWLIDLSQGASQRFTFGSLDARHPVWSPDGKRVFFSASSGGRFDLYSKPANGAGGEELLLKSNENKTASSISPDGRFLLYFTLDPKDGKAPIWVLPLEGGKKPFPFVQAAFDAIDAHFSPDGQWVAYWSDESGQWEVYVRRFTPGSAADSSAGGQWQVSYGRGHDPRWSQDGRELYYLTSGPKVMAAAVSTNPVFHAGKPHLLFQAPLVRSPGSDTGGFGNYTVDGKRFLFLAPAAQTGPAPPFDVELNWQAGLQK